MGIRRGPKSIVTENLIYAIDVANPDSHVSGSTSLNNQIDNQNNGVITNGVGFDEANGGSLNFDYQRIIDKSDAGSSTNGWGVVQRPASKYIYLFVDGGTVSTYEDSAASSGVWRNYLWTRKNTSTKLYVNGTLVNTYTYTRAVPADTTGMRIGSWNHSTGREFNGKIANIKVYNKELSAEEVLQNHNALKTRFGL
jgi:hypothetical protein